MKKKRGLSILVLLVLLLTITIGYSVLSSVLTISGTANISNATWDVHFDSITNKTGNVTPSVAPTISGGTTINFAVPLAKPGDYYDFYAVIKNAGSMNARLTGMNLTGLNGHTDYAEFTVTNTDGTALNANQNTGELLYAGSTNNTKTVKVHVAFKNINDPALLPSGPKELNLSCTLTYTQA